MQQAVVHTLRSIREVFDAESPYKSFQLLGYDFMVDDSHRVWLLECNGSPACASRLLPAFAADVVSTAINGMLCQEATGAFCQQQPAGGAGDVDQQGSSSRFELIASLGAQHK
mmetsp:Transcript_6012/g.16768  ORF Transcript_6012/g.16768 Transcript_6012/m.16768 type:complete len:113 (-) Transcript_6012:316-654(-)